MTRRTKAPADPLLTEDAYNRAARSLLVGLGFDVLVAVAFTLVTAFSTATSWNDVPPGLLAFALAKSMMQAIGSFVLRRFGDRSRFPTPIPPSD